MVGTFVTDPEAKEAARMRPADDGAVDRRADEKRRADVNALHDDEEDAIIVAQVRRGGAHARTAWWRSSIARIFERRCIGGAFARRRRPGAICWRSNITFLSATASAALLLSGGGQLGGAA